MIVIDGFHEVMIETRFARQIFVLSLSPTSDSNKNRIATPWLLTDSASDLISVHLWQPDVQQHDIGLDLVCNRQRLLTVILCPPGSVYLHALLRRFENACDKRTVSAFNCSGSDGNSIVRCP